MIRLNGRWLSGLGGRSHAGAGNRTDDDGARADPRPRASAAEVMTKTNTRPNTELTDTDTAAVETLQAIGSRIWSLRSSRNLTLQELGELTGLSASMLSLVERARPVPRSGRLWPSHMHSGSTCVIWSRATVRTSRSVSRREEQPEFHTPSGVRRRVLRDDRQRGLEVAINEYEPGTPSAEQPLHHEGFEYGSSSRASRGADRRSGI